MTTNLVHQWLRLQIEINADQRDVLADLLWQLETIGFSEDERDETLRVEAFFPPVGEVFPFLARVKSELETVGIKPVQCTAALYGFEPKAWIERYRSTFREFSVGETYFIHPPWSLPSRRHPVNIMIEPGLAFGTGTHESTQLVLLALESALSGVSSVLDVGTGTGILSIAARKLKPKLMLTAFDNDLLAVRSASENLKKNGVEGVQLFAGETAALKSRYDLVMANLTLAIFSKLAGELIRLSTKHLILSGFTSEQSASVLHFFRREAPVELTQDWSQNEWVCLHLEHETSAD